MCQQLGCSTAFPTYVTRRRVKWFNIERVKLNKLRGIGKSVYGFPYFLKTWSRWIGITSYKVKLAVDIQG